MIRSLLLGLLVAAPAVASADSWLPPTPITAVSHGGTYRLTVYPRRIAGPLAYVPDKEDGESPAGQRADAQARCEATLERLGATAYEQVWRRPLVNDVSPVSVLVAEDGRFVTFDNWHHVGIGPDAIVVYRADGTVVKSLGVADVVGERAYDALPRSVSSVWWHGEHRLVDAGAVLELEIVPGQGRGDAGMRTVRLSMSTGEVLPDGPVE